MRPLLCARVFPAIFSAVLSIVFAAAEADAVDVVRGGKPAATVVIRPDDDSSGGRRAA